MRLCSLAGRVKAGTDGMGLMGEKGGAQAGQLLVGLQSAEGIPTPRAALLVRVVPTSLVAC